MDSLVIARWCLASLTGVAMAQMVIAMAEHDPMLWAYLLAAIAAAYAWADVPERE